MEKGLSVSVLVQQCMFNLNVLEKRANDMICTYEQCWTVMLSKGWLDNLLDHIQANI